MKRPTPIPLVDENDPELTPLVRAAAQDLPTEEETSALAYRLAAVLPVGPGFEALVGELAAEAAAAGSGASTLGAQPAALAGKTLTASGSASASTTAMTTAGTGATAAGAAAGGKVLAGTGTAGALGSITTAWGGATIAKLGVCAALVVAGGAGSMHLLSEDSSDVEEARDEGQYDPTATGYSPEVEDRAGDRARARPGLFVEEAPSVVAPDPNPVEATDETSGAPAPTTAAPSTADRPANQRGIEGAHGFPDTHAVGSRPPLAARRTPPDLERQVPTEVELLRQARAAFSNDLARARQLLAEHASRFPRGALAQEREVLRIEISVRGGYRRDAERRASAFLTRFPRSPHARRVRVLVGEENLGTESLRSH